MGYLTQQAHKCASDLRSFTEVDVCEFIAGRKHWFKRLVGYFGLQIFKPATINRLKDIFIHNLLNKKLIQISNAEMMQRRFGIVTERGLDEFWRDMYFKEMTKRKADEGI